jgi:hypothetical protein
VHLDSGSGPAIGPGRPGMTVVLAVMSGLEKKPGLKVE